MRAGVRKQLEAAVRDRALISIKRACDRFKLEGFAVGIGEWLLLHVLEPQAFVLNGYVAVRVRHISQVVLLARHSDGFAVHALRLRGFRPRTQPRISLGNAKELISTAARQFPLLTIRTELIDDSVCWIGQPLGFPGASVEMRELTPAARWDDEPARHPLRSITRVDFGGGYEAALSQVEQWRGGCDRRAPRS